MSARSWRLFHRWLGAIAALFLCFAGLTGAVLAATEFFGEAEAERERLRDVVSGVTTDAPETAFTEPLLRAVRTAAAQQKGAPIDSIELKLKGDRPIVAICTCKPAGGEDKRHVVDARTGALIATTDYSDKSFLHRLHSGEAFGDGGLVMRSEEHTSELQSPCNLRMPSSA